jgi:hypothetical protein
MLHARLNPDYCVGVELDVWAADARRQTLNLLLESGEWIIMQVIPNRKDWL